MEAHQWPSLFHPEQFWLEKAGGEWDSKRTPGCDAGGDGLPQVKQDKERSEPFCSLPRSAASERTRSSAGPANASPSHPRLLGGDFGRHEFLVHAGYRKAWGRFSLLSLGPSR